MTETGAASALSGGPANDNVDQREIEKFAALARRWWDARGEFRPLHLLNPLRLGYISERVGGLTGKRVADIGCGGGLLSEAMAAAGARVTGIDMAGPALAVARLHGLEQDIAVDYRQTTAEALADAEPGRYDLVTCMELLEHVPDPPSLVAACRRLVHRDGHVLFSTLNRNGKSWLLAIVGAEYILGLLPRGTHEYARFIRPSELARACRTAGLAVQDLSGIGYNPLTERFRLTGDCDVNYLLYASVA